MKKFIAFLLCLIFVLTAFASCNSAPEEPDDIGENSPSKEDTDPIVEPDPVVPEEPEYEELDPMFLTAAKTYTDGGGAVLSAYPGEPVESYEGVCAFYEGEGFELYCENNFNNNLFSTYTNGSELAHVYWIEALNELNIVTSATGAENLPPKEITVEGDIPLSVTQLQQLPSETSGMSYVIQLSDGSFVIYDGGYASTCKELCNTLNKLSETDEIHIRAWLITHSHDDHYSCLEAFHKQSRRYLKSLKIDYFLIAPINAAEAIPMDKDANYLATNIHYDSELFEGSKVCYVHTGMSFNFCNLRMDILYTPNDLFIDGNTGYFNDTSIISRVYSNQPDSKDTLSMIFLGDAGVSVAERLMLYYGDFLRTDMCQISHHGVENFPLLAYRMIKAPVLFYPCNTSLYNLTNRDAEVRAALRESVITKEILLRDNARYTRYFNPELNPEIDPDSKFPTE